jgi:hypothetical protein
MTEIPPVRIPNWVPPAARQGILNWWNQPATTPHQRAVLRRLATDDRMHTEVWQPLQKLSDAAGTEDRIDQIITWVMVGLELASTALRPRPPTSKAEVADYLTKHPTTGRLAEYLAKHPTRRGAQTVAMTDYAAKYPPILTAESAAVRAGLLLEAMDEQRQNAEGLWQEYAQRMWGEQTFSYRNARNIVAWLEHFFWELRADNQANAATLKLPNIRKKQASNAKELYLSEFLSQRFIDRFDQPHDAIVAALVSVALGLKKSPATETIQGRRRHQRAMSSNKPRRRRRTKISSKNPR